MPKVVILVLLADLNGTKDFKNDVLVVPEERWSLDRPRWFS
jgi:hypothetical protein